MTTLEKIRAARELISDPGHWTRGCEARDAWGNPVNCSGPSAASFCAAGAMWRVGGGTAPMYQANPQLESVAGFNDSHTHAEVLALFDETIAYLEANP